MFYIHISVIHASLSIISSNRVNCSQMQPNAKEGSLLTHKALLSHKNIAKFVHIKPKQMPGN